MGAEIERKFLVANDRWRVAADHGTRIVQGYLCSDIDRSVRVRISGEQAWLTLKSGANGITRLEYEYSIPVADAEEILDQLCSGAVLRKTRYRVPNQEHIWEVDVFEGENEGLVLAEVELRAENEVFAEPDWLAGEVSFDRRYLNASLVREPWSRWDTRDPQ